MERCPNCKARYQEGDSCRRCGMDLHQLLQIEKRVQSMEQAAVEKILDQNAFAAEKLLQAALALQYSPTAKCLLDFIQNDLTYFCRKQPHCR